MRKTNIELLRILAFLMVICIHVTGIQLSTNAMPIGTFNWQFTNLLNGMSRVAIPCFVLISGYFMCSQQVKLMRVIKKTIIVLLFYGSTIYFIYLYKIPEVVTPFSSALKAFFTSGGVFYHIWYIYVYIGLVMLSPFINIGLNNMSRNIQMKLLGILYLLCSILPTINQFAQDLIVPDGLYTTRLLLFITLYIQGAYIKRHGINVTKSLSLAIYLVSVISVALLTNIYSVMSGKSVTSFYDYSNIFVILGAISLFLFFHKIKENRNRYIGIIASCTYGGYLVHVLFISMLQWFLPQRFIPYLSYNSMFFVVKNLSFIGAVFVCSILIEFIRLTVINLIKKRINKTIN